MNTTRLALAALAATVLDGIYGFAVYGNALSNQFAAFPGVFRSAEAQSMHLPVMFCGLNIGGRLTLAMALAGLGEWLLVGCTIGLVYKRAKV